MSRGQKFKAEEIIGKLREAEVELAVTDRIVIVFVTELLRTEKGLGSGPDVGLNVRYEALLASHQLLFQSFKEESRNPAGLIRRHYPGSEK